MLDDGGGEKSIKFEMKIEQIVYLPIGIYLHRNMRLLLLMWLLLTPPQAILLYTRYTHINTRSVCVYIGRTSAPS